MQKKVVRIHDRQIGDERPVYIIAEAGVNHNGNLEMALQLVDVAKDSGADAVKFQTFEVDDLASASAPKAQYQVEQTNADESQFEMLKKLELSFDDFRELQAYCGKRGITFLSTPFGPRSADLLEGLGVPAFKIPSGEITNHPLLRHVAGKKRPMLMSTGMSTLAEIETAVQVVRAAGAVELALFHCVSCYPTRPEEANIRAIETMKNSFGVPVGFSDHTLGFHTAMAAVARGANLIEKHFTLDNKLDGPDHASSLEPRELAEFVRQIRDVELSLGTGEKVPQERERDVRTVARRSLFAVVDVPQGTLLRPEMLKALRPGNGIAPTEEHIRDCLSCRAARPIKAGTMLEQADLERS